MKKFLSVILSVIIFAGAAFASVSVNVNVGDTDSDRKPPEMQNNDKQDKQRPPLPPDDKHPRREGDGKHFGNDDKNKDHKRPELPPDDKFPKREHGENN